MIDLAGDISAALPRSVVEAAAEALDHLSHRPLSSSKVLIVGIAYKRNIDDLRESPALPIMQILKRRGAQVSYHDPHVASTERAHAEGIENMHSIPWTQEALAGFDCAIIVTDHHGVDYELMLETIPVVVDTRNATAKFAGSLRAQDRQGVDCPARMGRSIHARSTTLAAFENPLNKPSRFASNAKADFLVFGFLLFPSALR